jgi:hypothetical protein
MRMQKWNWRSSSVLEVKKKKSGDGGIAKSHKQKAAKQHERHSLPRRVPYSRNPSDSPWHLVVRRTDR